MGPSSSMERTLLLWFLRILRSMSRRTQKRFDMNRCKSLKVRSFGEDRSGRLK